MTLDTVGHFLNDGSDEQPPDLVFLLRALAPYLRLEKMAYLDPLALFRLFNHASRYCDHVQRSVCKHLKVIILHRYMYTPRKLCPCLVCCCPWATDDNPPPRGRSTQISQDLLRHWNIPGAQMWKSDMRWSWRSVWLRLKQDWEQEFQSGARQIANRWKGKDRDIR